MYDREWGLGFGVWGLGFGVWGLGFGVWGLGPHPFAGIGQWLAQQGDDVFVNDVFRSLANALSFSDRRHNRCLWRNAGVDPYDLLAPVAA